MADHQHDADAGRKAELGADAKLAEIENAHSCPLTVSTNH
jgi:hypothetical protein